MKHHSVHKDGMQEHHTMSHPKHHNPAHHPEHKYVPINHNKGVAPDLLSYAGGKGEMHHSHHKGKA